MNNTLTLSGITKGYNHGKPNEVQVLRGVDLTVGEGEVVALVAPSGAGNRRFSISRGYSTRRTRAWCPSGARI